MHTLPPRNTRDETFDVAGLTELGGRDILDQKSDIALKQPHGDPSDGKSMASLSCKPFTSPAR